jgi:hypothetical protein
VSVELRSVSFNLLSASGGGALNVRRNAIEHVDVPEISAEQPSSHIAAACYTFEQLNGGSVPIRIQVRRTLPESNHVEVRALPLSIPELPAPWFAASLVPAITWPSSPALAYWALWYAFLEQQGAATPPGPAGGVMAGVVDFDQGTDAAVTLSADVSALPQQGVGAYPVRWRWQFRRSASDPWVDFAFTRHTMYVIVSEPTTPWLQGPNVPANTQLPWLEVLDVACRWASGAANRDQAAARVTEEVYALGERGVLEYDCAGPSVLSLGTPHYTVLPGVFDCTRFLERVRGRLGNGPFVNCSDCATAVATFANILGCDLFQSRMFGVLPFPLNPTRGIGTHNWLSACGLGAFTMHEVAWTGDCLEDDDVYDACLALDGDADPTRAPHTPQLPTGLRFGASPQGFLSYRDRLVAPAGRLTCQPQPATRQRRFII